MKAIIAILVAIAAVVGALMLFGKYRSLDSFYIHNVMSKLTNRNQKL
jgi:hypothetical protein